MTPRTVLFIQNIRTVVDGLTVEELYQVALALRDTAARRGLDCGPESKALTCALLVAAQAQQRTLAELCYGEVYCQACSDYHRPDQHR